MLYSLLMCLENELGFASFCAVKIQSLVRMRRAMHLIGLKASVVCQIAAIIIQMKFRNYLSRPDEDNLDITDRAISIRSHRESRDVAVLRIQSLWRRYCNRKIFMFYKSLVLEKLRGAPSDLLRNIIPREVDLLDRAAGIHVRFRLGGYSFPPKIFFKIFTHRGVCDVGAFAPRNYKREVLHNRDLFQHTKGEYFSESVKNKMSIRVGASYYSSVVSRKGQTDDWYIRDEGNYWRPIAIKFVEDTFEEAKALKSYGAPFHHNKIRRKQDVELLRKKKQREWMAKAYRLARIESFKELQHVAPQSPSSKVYSSGDKFDEAHDEENIVQWR